MIYELWSKKELRDARARELRAQGYTVRKSSHRMQLLPAGYVEDAKQGLTPEQCGFGNAIYRTLWPVLYEVEADEV